MTGFHGDFFPPPPSPVPLLLLLFFLPHPISVTFQTQGLVQAKQVPCSRVRPTPLLCDLKAIVDMNSPSQKIKS